MRLSERNMFPLVGAAWSAGASTNTEIRLGASECRRRDRLPVILTKGLKPRPTVLS